MEKSRKFWLIYSIIVGSISVLIYIFYYASLSESSCACSEARFKNLAIPLMIDMEEFKEAYQNVINNGTTPNHISLNGAYSVKSNMLNKIYGPVCLDLDGNYTEDANKCSEMNKSVYLPQVFSMKLGAGMGFDRAVHASMTLSRQDYVFTSLRIKDIRNGDIGTPAPDHVVLVMDLKEGMCALFNKTVWGDRAIWPARSMRQTTFIPASGLPSLDALVQGATILSTRGEAIRDKGACVSTADGRYFAYRVLVVQ